MKDFNLLVSSARGTEGEANEEIRYLLRELGDTSASTDCAPVSGLTVAKTILDPVKVISALHRILRDRPWQFRYILKVKRVEQVVTGESSAIGSAVVGRVKKVGVEAAFS